VKSASSRMAGRCLVGHGRDSRARSTKEVPGPGHPRRPVGLMHRTKTPMPGGPDRGRTGARRGEEAPARVARSSTRSAMFYPGTCRTGEGTAHRLRGIGGRCAIGADCPSGGWATRQPHRARRHTRFRRGGRRRTPPARGGTAISSSYRGRASSRRVPSVLTRAHARQEPRLAS
jgi:hypothetical protein